MKIKGVIEDLKIKKSFKMTKKKKRKKKKKKKKTKSQKLLKKKNIYMKFALKNSLFFEK